MMSNPFDSGYYETQELQKMSFKKIGKNVKIAKNCTIIGIENVEIGDNVRIDGFCTIVAAGKQGKLKIGSYIHIASYCYLSAGAGIYMEDFSGLSQGVRIYSKTDDYSGNYLTNPTVPENLTGVESGLVEIKKHVIIGSGAVILPKITIGEGASIGALSLVVKDLDSWSIYAGVPAKRIKDRSKQLLELEKKLKQSN